MTPLGEVLDAWSVKAPGMAPYSFKVDLLSSRNVWNHQCPLIGIGLPNIQILTGRMINIRADPEHILDGSGSLFVGVANLEDQEGYA
jgi:hypothetical protein